MSLQTEHVLPITLFPSADKFLNVKSPFTDIVLIAVNGPSIDREDEIAAAPQTRALSTAIPPLKIDTVDPIHDFPQSDIFESPTMNPLTENIDPKVDAPYALKADP
jgi:hypothetical protein